MDITTTKDSQGNHVVQLKGRVHAPLRAVWEMFADTQRLYEQAFGMPPIAAGVVSRTGAQGKMRLGVFELIFEEKPWLYQAPHRYQSVRIFSKGPLERLGAALDLAGAAAGASDTSTDVDYRVHIAPHEGPIGWAAGKVATSQVASGLEAVRAWLLELAAGRAPPAFVRRGRDGVRKRAEAFAPALAADGHAAVLVEGLLEHIAAGPDDEVARMRPYALAEKWGQPKEQLLSLCLGAVRAGLLQMRWESICAWCKGPVHEAANLEAVPDQHSCLLCEFETIASRTSNVAAVFAPVFDVRRAARTSYCLGSPGRTPHWLAQLVLEPGSAQDLPMQLGAGRYLLQSPGIKQRTVLDVGETGEERVAITLERARGGQPPLLPSATPTLREGKVSLALKNEDADSHRMQLVHDGCADLSATAAHVVATVAWQRLNGQSPS